MRIAVMSDIHGNYGALADVLKDIACSKIDCIVNLGDSIGYGPEPEEVLNLIEKRDIINILGNHEQAILEKTYRQCFMLGAIKTIEHTMRFLTTASLLYLKTLPKTVSLNEALFVHGCPPDSNIMYLNYLTISEIEDVFKSFPHKIAFAGHTHRFMLISYNSKTVDFLSVKDEPMVLDPSLRYILNVGSVGQPRDNDSRAGYVIWDTVPNSFEVKRIPYDIRTTADKIIQRGFQKKDADRLFAGG